MTVGVLYKVCDQFCVRTGGWDWRTHGAPAGASKTPKTGDWAYSRLGASSESQGQIVGASLNGRKKNGVKITFLPAIFPARLDFPRSSYLPLGLRGWTGSDCSLPTK